MVAEFQLAAELSAPGIGPTFRMSHCHGLLGRWNCSCCDTLNDFFLFFLNFGLKAPQTLLQHSNKAVH